MHRDDEPGVSICPARSVSASRARRRCPNRGRHRPQFAPSAAMSGGRWRKTTGKWCVAKAGQGLPLGSIVVAGVDSRPGRRETSVPTHHKRRHRSCAEMFRAMQENPGRAAARVSAAVTFAEAKIRRKRRRVSARSRRHRYSASVCRRRTQNGSLRADDKRGRLAYSGPRIRRSHDARLATRNV